MRCLQSLQLDCKSKINANHSSLASLTIVILLLLGQDFPTKEVLEFPKNFSLVN